jgi:hypothetical protein
LDLAYKTNLDVMDYRCSNSVAGLVLLIGGSCAVLAPAARAGDRIDFSAPTIPLAIPRPDAEIKEPQKQTSSASLADGPTYDADFAPAGEITVTVSRTKEKDPWNSNPLQDAMDPRATDGLFSAQPESSRLASGSVFNMKHGRDANEAEPFLLRKADSKFGADPNATRPGARNGWDKDGVRNGDLFGRDYAAKKNESSLLKMFTLDPASSGFSAWQTKSFTGESESLTGVGSEGAKIKLGLTLDSAHSSAMPAGYGSYDPADKRQTDQQAATTPGYVRAWEPGGTHPAAPRRSSNPGALNSSRVVAPNRPAVLPIPKRPSDPNPY